MVFIDSAHSVGVVMVFIDSAHSVGVVMVFTLVYPRET